MQGADIAALQKAVIKAGNPCSCITFVIPGADIAALQEAVISGNVSECYLFARDIPGADIAALQEAVIKAVIKPGNCYLFAKDVWSRYCSSAKNSHKAGNVFECTTFAKDVQGVDIAALQEAVIKAGNAFECYPYSC